MLLQERHLIAVCSENYTEHINCVLRKYSGPYIKAGATYSKTLS